MLSSSTTTTFSPVYLFLSFHILSFVSGYQLGAPTNACTDRTPQHGVVAQTSLSPFLISSETVVSNVKVTLSSPTYSNIKGFLMQARQGTIDGQTLGTWFPQTNSQLIQCTNEYDSTTHMDNLDKSLPLEFLWNPQTSDQGDVVFVATVVVNKTTFWVDITSSTGTDNPCSPNPCQNGGVCLQGSQTNNAYICSCASGYVGTNCETDNPCSPNPCQNGGVCLQGSQTNHAYICNCASGYFGENCETDNPCSPNPCQNGGVCLQGSQTNSYLCRCASGYFGTNCETDACSPSPCLNGDCLRTSSSPLYTCQCSSEFTGTICDTPVSGMCSSSPCLYGGNCTEVANGYSCNCMPGYEGNRCATNINECSSEPCENQGACDDGVNEFTCNCPPEFEGNFCEIPIQSVTTGVTACSSPCVRGTCTDEDDGFVCECDGGFMGPTCELVDFCADSPCKNSGTCISITGPICACVDGYRGKDCSTVTAAAEGQTSEPLIEWYWVALLAVFGLFIIFILVSIYCACKRDTEPPTYY